MRSPVFYRPRLNVCLRREPDGKTFLVVGISTARECVPFASTAGVVDLDYSIQTARRPPELRQRRIEPSVPLLDWAFYGRGFKMKHFIAAALFSMAIILPALAQKLVDPASVAPEFREAAERRRAEQIRQRDCAKKADTEKVMPRERTAFLVQCLEADAAK